MPVNLPTELQDAEYVSLATFRKSGKEVPTAVWAAPLNDHLYIFSEAKAGKVKRLRNSPRAKLATCGATGKITGNWHDAEGYIVDDETEIAEAYKALRKKYGWKMFLTDTMSKISGRYHKRAMLKVRMASDSSKT